MASKQYRGSKMVPIVDATSSKATEIAALEKMFACAEEGSYLASLLTPQLVDWVKGQIELDLPADIMGERGFEADKRVELQVEVREINEHIAFAEHKREGEDAAAQAKHQAELRSVRAEVSSLEGALRGWQNRWAAAYDKAQAYRTALVDVWGLLEQMMERREAAERTIQRTKTLAFDLLVRRM